MRGVGLSGYVSVVTVYSDIMDPPIVNERFAV
jgi:hypothetical protein